jgi:DNA-binding NarL/FixJ family response regulator
LRIALVDDHPLVRAGLAALLEDLLGAEIVGQAGDGAEALELVGRTRPDVLLMDLSMPGTGGIEATALVRSEHPELPIVVLTSSRDGDDLRAALRAGAGGFVVKDADPDEIAAAVRGAARGQLPIDPRMTRVLLEAPPAASAAEAHTKEQAPADVRAPAPPVPLVRGREAEVLHLVAQGLANKQIARELGISERTVKVHVSSLFRRLGVGDRVSAALWARENGY